MKKITYLFAVLLLFAACNPDQGPDPTSGDVREVLEGYYTANESSTLFPDPTTFSVRMTIDSSTTDGMFVYNFYHLGNDEVDRVKVSISTGKVHISPQTVCGFVIEGDGDISGNKINLKYSVNTGTDVDQVTSNWVKQ